MAFDRQGSRLFILDDIKGTVESCGPLGEDHHILLYYQNTKPVDVEWYGGSPLWTDDSPYRGIGFVAKRGGPSTGITSLNQFQKATGIHVYYGQVYERQAGKNCLEDEFTCNDTVCIPISWRCDGLVDCDDDLDEASCYSDEPDSIVFVTDLDEGAIFMATTTNLTFTKLPLTGLQTPVAVDYDPVDGIVYWTDSSNRSINSARINGTNQKTVIDGLGTPDGMYFDVQTKTIYWTDALHNTIEAVHHNGTGRHNILSDLDKPRAIIIVSTNRMIYWTEWGDSPKIELCDLTGNNRQVVISTGLGWPNGITYDREGSRLYWCDAKVDKIESSNLYGSDRKLLLDNSHGTLHPFDIIFHHGTLMWSDWKFDGIGVNEGSQHAWPKNYILPGGFSQPGGFHVFEDINECESNPCMNGGSCEEEIDMFTCTCVPGYVGPTCAIETDECVSRPCLNGASCDDLINMYICDCLPGYTGTNCEIEIEVCASSPCLNRATCNDLLNMYTCTCAPGHTGTVCEIVTELEPIQVLSSPTSLTINALEPVEMMCSFENAIRFEWQKDNVTIPGTEHQRVYTIASMTPAHIGYYRCQGEGRNQNGASTVVFTDQATVYITELSNIIIENGRFNINVNSSGDLSDITSQYYQDAAEMVTNYVQTGIVKLGTFEEHSLYVVPSNLREGSIIANLNMYVEDNETSSFQIKQSVKDSFLALSSLPDGILDASTVRVISTSICPNFTWVSRFGEALFAEGELNSRYNSTGRDCPFNTTNAHQPVATALCVGDRISRAVWVPENNCGDFRNVTELLKEIDNVEITQETVEDITDQVAIITKNTGEITASDVTLVSNIATVVAALNNSGREFTAVVTSIVSNIASVDMIELQQAEETTNAISNILMAYETQLNNVDVAEGEPFDVSEENIAVQVRSVPAEELNQGLVLSLSGNSSTDLSGSNINVRAGEDTPSEGRSVGVIAEVSFPPEIAAITLGALTGNVNNTNINIIMSVFSTPVLFFSPSLLNFSSENPGVNRTANTPVILLSVGGVVVADLDQSINLTFTALVSDYVNQMCVFWDEDDSEWSSEGCRLVSSRSVPSMLSGVSARAPESNNSENVLEDLETMEMYTCACDHLTNFAILMDIHDVTTEYTYNILSYIGCAISTVCLLIALGTYLWNKKLRSRQTHKIFICLCATMLGLYTSFLALLVLDTTRGDTVVNSVACGFLAGLIQFFVLSSIAWMGVEGFNTYLVIVQIFNTYIPNFMVKAGLAAWGIPAIIVILTGGIANTNYAREDVCFLRLWSQVGGLLIPVAVVLIANMVIFIMVIRQLSKSAQIAGKIKKDKDGKREEMIERVKNAVAILVLMGLTWTTGYLLLIEAFTLVVQALFILFNSFQGLFIFILYCVRKPLIRQQWGLTCSWCDGESTQSGGRRVSSASDSLTTISKFFGNKRKKKYSIGEESLTGASNGTDSSLSAPVSNLSYNDLDFGTYIKQSDESKV
ncbi:adhesion G-protein coupled receptor G4 isoform X2 [Strongylocentrotus purpuratus]|nr:adhesion G-protein coupled receptor G4 isoform X2 [Strongylocentrotus purpuratus]